MPVVPVYENFRAEPSAQPQTYAQEPSTPNAQQIGGQQLEALGNAQQRFGGVVAGIEQSMAERVNQIKVNDAVNKARQSMQTLTYDPKEGFANLKGDQALTRPNGQDIIQEYGDKLKSRFSEIAQTLGNDAQRQAFESNAGDLTTSFHGSVSSHMLSEFRNHAISVHDATINLAADDAKTKWQDPNAMAPSINAAKTAVYEKGIISGWSASQIAAAQLDTTSRIHTTAIKAALAEGNADYAAAYLSARKKDMTADDVLSVQGAVTHQTQLGQAQRAVAAISVQAAQLAAPTPFDKLVQITMSAESGGKRYAADGKTLLTSPAGAKGEMQVMDATNRDPGFGVRPAQDNSPEERARVGRDYLHALVQKYQSPDRAWAAYNAGPRTLNKALKRYGNDWLAHMPQETRAYVRKNMAKLGNGNQLSSATPDRMTELEFINSAVAQLPAGAPPSLIALTQEQARTQFGVVNRSLNEAGQNALAQAQRWLATNQGNYAAIPAELVQSVNRYAPGHADDLLKYAKTFQPEAPPEVKTDLVLYNRLTAHSGELKKMSDTQFEFLRHSLSPADFKHFSNLRLKEDSVADQKNPQTLDTRTIDATLNERLQSLKINTAPSHKDLTAQERLGGIKKFVKDSIFDAQAQAGKKLTPAEITSHIDGLFAKSVEFKHTFLGFDTGTTNEKLLLIQPSDIPKPAAEGIKRALAARGNAAPTEIDVLNMYRAIHARN